MSRSVWSVTHQPDHVVKLVTLYLMSPNPKPFVVFKAGKERVAVIPSRVVAVSTHTRSVYDVERKDYLKFPTCTIIVDGESAGSDGVGFTVDGTLEEVISALKGE